MQTISLSAYSWGKGIWKNPGFTIEQNKNNKNKQTKIPKTRQNKPTPQQKKKSTLETEQETKVT